MSAWVHADDLGLSVGVNDAIFECVDHDAVGGVSLMATGGAFDHAVAGLGGRPGIRVHAHLDLCEGRPLLAPAEVPLLVDAEGRFCHSFHSLWWAHASGSRAVKEALARQAANEWEAQARKVNDALGGPGIGIDSHRHYHLIPFLFDIVLDLAGRLGATHVRIPEEPGVLALARRAGAPAPANLAKHAVLNALARPARRRLATAGVPSTEAFVGVLYSGAMTRAVVGAAGEAVRRRLGRSASLEILFHPGGARPDEAALWPPGSPLGGFYLSPDRRREADELKHPELAAIVDAV